MPKIDLQDITDYEQLELLNYVYTGEANCSLEAAFYLIRSESILYNNYKLTMCVMCLTSIVI